MAKRARHAEIAGAGIAGLTAAAVLANRGWSVRVHERGSELREIGAGIFVWENGLRVLEEIGAYDEVVRFAEECGSWELRDERNRQVEGGWMVQDVRLRTVLRTDLHRAIAEAAERAGVEVVTDSIVSHATPDGALVTDSGDSLQADLVLAADGVFSRVREWLQLGLVMQDLRDGCGRHLIPREAADPVGKTVEHWRGGRRVGIVPCHPDEVYVYLCCPADDAAGRTKPVDKESWIDSFPHLEHVIDRIPDVSRWAVFYNVVCRSWSAGRVGILGDAAHAMSPNLGQGACVGMANASALGLALDSYPDVETALAEWERSERPITDATQKYSGLYGRVGTSWPAPLLDARSALVWALGHSNRFKRKANVAAHHVPTFPASGTA